MPALGDQSQTDLETQLLSEARRRSLEEYVLHVPLVVGVSGGADSLAMLHLLCRLRGKEAGKTLHVAHLNHWFRGKEASDDADFVRDIATAWGLSSTIEAFDVPNYARRNKLSQEDAARRVRYSFLGSIAREHGAAVAVAHNADDQVETVLMNLLRGAGIGGLSGMEMLATLPVPPQNGLPEAFGPSADDIPVKLFRPLLHVWRHRIIAYCKEAGLQPRFDSTNWERTYRRNRIRHDLIPLLQMQYSLAVKDHLFNLSQIATAEDNLLDTIVDEEWQRTAAVSTERDSVAFESAEFSILPEAMRRRLARKAIETVAGTLHDITFDHIETAVGILSSEPQSARSAHFPHGLIICAKDGRGRISRRDTSSSAATITDPEQLARPLLEPGTAIAISGNMSLVLGGRWQFLAQHCAAAGPENAGDSVALFDSDALAALGQLTLRTREPGDFIQPEGMTGHKSLQDLMVDAKIPRELRDSLPVIAIEGSHEVLWVPGHGGRRSRYALITERTKETLQLMFIRD